MEYSKTRKLVNKKKPHKNTRDTDVIDLDLGATLIGNDREAAKEMLDMLMVQLTDEQASIELAYHQADYQKLVKLVHKIHGGACYCGTPRLKKATANLEKVLYSNDESAIKINYQQFQSEVQALFIAYEELK